MGSLLPSPFLAASSTTPRHASGPLSTLYEAPRLQASPRSWAGARDSPRRAATMMRDEDEQQRDDDEMPATPPRRLLDLFVQSASKSVGGMGSPGRTNGTMQLPSPRRVLSPAPARKEEKVEEEALPTWSFYEDDDDDSAAAPTAPSDSSAVAFPAPEDDPMTVVDDPDAIPVDKENSCPPPRRLRSTSLLSQSSSVTLAAPSPTVASLSNSASDSANPSPARPSVPPISVPPAPTFERTHPDSEPRTPEPTSPSSPSRYPSWSETTTAYLFSESGPTSFSSTTVSHSEGSELSLGPAFAAGGGGGKKRPSLEEAGGDDKRFRPEGTDDA
ncbi:hypothetical protein JCM1841_004961 [Sporobolomyces salmonicolor]